MLVFAIPDVNRIVATKRHVAGAGALTDRLLSEHILASLQKTP